MSQRMGRKFDANRILREKDPEEVARNAFDIALEFALLGYVEEATELFNLFEAYSSVCKTSWSPGLYFAWEATGLWPESVTVEERTEEALQKMEVERILYKRDKHATDEGLEALIAAGTGEGRTNAWGEQQIRIDDLTAAIDLALYLNKRDKALDILQIFADKFQQTWQELSKSRQVWRFLKHKALANTIEVDETKLKKFFEEVMETFKERVAKGSRRIFKDVSMKELVGVCNENTLKNAVWEALGVDPEEPPVTILREGATSEQIAELEARLGASLPEDFKEFLSLTNGIQPLWNGMDFEPELLGTDNIHVFDATDEQADWIKASVKINFVTDMSVQPDWPTLERTVMINDGGKETKYVWLVEPEYARENAKRFYAAFLKCPPEEQAKIQKKIEYMHAGRSDPNALDWQVWVWSPRSYDLTSWLSWREYVEFLAEGAAIEDSLDEEDAQGRLLYSHDVFAYQLCL